MDSSSHLPFTALNTHPGQGLLIANGDKWFRNRRLLTPAFHFEILKPYVQVYNDCTAILLVRHLNHIGAQHVVHEVSLVPLQSKWQERAARGEPVEVYKAIDLLSLDVVLRCAFSYDSNCQQERFVNHVS